MSLSRWCTACKCSPRRPHPLPTGKRVNFTCRSVISPDPNIGTHEIGIPDRFAKVLTYPEPITPWNVVELRQAVINGPSVHPGATMVQEASGHLVDLSKLSKTQRIAIAKRLLVANDADNAQTRLIPATSKGFDGAAAAAAALAATAAAQVAGESGGNGLTGTGAKRPLFSAVSDLARLSAVINGSGSGAFGGEQAVDAAVAGVALGRTGRTASSCKKVWRHLRTGDALLVNRQPTLHKPGIMAHKARVLIGEKVIRMHYANCNTYNADFDGDEMNVHMCQNELARAEAYGIAATDHQYIVPTNGKPLRGLIQDHIVMGVLLTKRDTFLSRSEVMQLLHLAQMDLRGLKRHGRVAPLPVPALLKPQVRWTGKQVISHLLLHLHPHARHLSMEAGTKTPASAWSAAKGRGKPEPEDATVIVRRGELLQGVLDKAAFGASEFGLVHCVHELLGGEATGRLLTQLGKLFTGFNQMVGFTCGIADLLLNPEADEARLALHVKADDLGLAGVRAFVGAEALDAGIPRAVLNRKVGATDCHRLPLIATDRARSSTGRWASDFGWPVGRRRAPSLTGR